MKNLNVLLFALYFAILSSCKNSENDPSPETYLIVEKWVTKKYEVNQVNELELVAKYSLTNIDKLKLSSFKYHFISESELAVTIEYIFDSDLMNKIISETYYFDKDNMQLPILLKGDASMGKITLYC